MYSGHVTAGGSICIENLVQTGGADGWQPAFTVEGILATVAANMMHCKSVMVQTQT